MIYIEKNNFPYCDFCEPDTEVTSDNPIHKVTIKMDKDSVIFHTCAKHLKELRDEIDSALNL